MGSSLARESAFRETIEAVGHQVSTCHAEYLPRPTVADSWLHADRRIDAWLKGLPKPVGILSQNDVPARDLADRCRVLGLNVPHDVALMGVDDDQLECHLCHRPLTSIAIPGQRIGFEAARVLDRLLIGRKPKLLHQYFPPVRVVPRQSTDTLAIEDEVVATVLKTIHQQAAGGTNVNLICQQLDISRRQVERRFRAQLGTTVSAEICRVRVELAKQLLAETELKMPLVAAQSGFGDARRLSVVFKQQTGQGPLAFRRSSRAGSSGE